MRGYIIQSFSQDSHLENEWAKEIAILNSKEKISREQFEEFKNSIRKLYQNYWARKFELVSMRHTFLFEAVTAAISPVVLSILGQDHDNILIKDSKEWNQNNLYRIAVMMVTFERFGLSRRIENRDIVESNLLAYKEHLIQSGKLQTEL